LYAVKARYSGGVFLNRNKLPCGWGLGNSRESFVKHHPHILSYPLRHSIESSSIRIFFLPINEFELTKLSAWITSREMIQTEITCEKSLIISITSDLLILKTIRQKRGNQKIGTKNEHQKKRTKQVVYTKDLG
jgi:hypothetical protein